VNARPAIFGKGSQQEIEAAIAKLGGNARPVPPINVQRPSSNLTEELYMNLMSSSTNWIAIRWMFRPRCSRAIGANSFGNRKVMKELRANA
jgi:hypothetical protein